MKSKFLNLGLLLTSLIGYLEWGRESQMFLVEGEMIVLSRLFRDPSSVLDPFALLPLAGQLLLILTLFQRKPGRILTLAGLGCLGILLLFMFIIGITDLNFKILLSTIPFLTISVLTIIHHRVKKFSV